MVSAWMLLAAAVGGFYLGVVVMALRLMYRDRRRIAKPAKHHLEGLSPFDSPSQA